MPALLAQPPAGQHCAFDRWRQRDRAPDTAPNSSIDADGVAASGLGGTLTIGIALHLKLARLESP